MALSITTAAESTDLTTVEMMRLELGVDPDPTTDAIIGRHIAVASDAINRFCGQNFAKQTYTETMQGNGGNYLMLSRMPLVSITSITYDGDTVAASEYEIADAKAGLVYAENGWYYDTVGLNYSVVYIAGYVLPSMSGTRDLPDMLEQACIMYAKNRYLARERDFSVAEEEIPDVYKVKYNGAASGKGRASSLMTPEIEDILSAYRMRRL